MTPFAGNPLEREKRQLVTCPGIAGFCSASYPGDTCLVVCDFGRNNVPECMVSPFKVIIKIIAKQTFPSARRHLERHPPLHRA